MKCIFRLILSMRIHTEINTSLSSIKKSGGTEKFPNVPLSQNRSSFGVYKMEQFYR